MNLRFKNSTWLKLQTEYSFCGISESAEAKLRHYTVATEKTDGFTLFQTSAQQHGVHVDVGYGIVLNGKNQISN